MKRIGPISGIIALTSTLSALAQSQNQGAGEGVRLATAQIVVWLLAGALVLIVAVVYIVRNRSERDPSRIITPRFKPPRGVSAALAAYLSDRAATSRVFTAAVAELAARGLVKVVGGPKPRIDRLPHPPDERPPLELRALMEALLPQRRPQLELGSENGEILLLAKSELERNLTKAAAPYLQPNDAAVTAVELLSSLALALATGLVYGRYEAAIITGIVVFAYVFLGAIALRAAARSWDRYQQVPGLIQLRELARLTINLLFVLLIPLMGGYWLGVAAGKTAGALAALVMLAGTWGAYLLPALTPEGAEVWRHLLGLARYLSTTDAEELRRIGAPEDAPEILRQLYPYAIALGVESAFARRLENHLNAYPDDVQAAMLWDTGTESYPRMVGQYTYSLGVSRALRAAYQQAGAYTPKLPRKR